MFQIGSRETDWEFSLRSPSNVPFPSLIFRNDIDYDCLQKPQFLDCFRLRADGTRYDLFESQLGLWLRPALYSIGRWAPSYYPSFREHLFTQYKESNLTQNQNTMIRIMDSIDASSKGTEQRVPDLDTTLGTITNLFADPSVLEIAYTLFHWTMYQVLSDQKQDILSKFGFIEIMQAQHAHLDLLKISLLGMGLGETIQELMDSIMQDLTQQIIRALESMIKCDVAEASRQLEEMDRLNTRWRSINDVLDVAVTIIGWLVIPELNPFNIHVTQVSGWSDHELQFFCELVAVHGLDIVRYKVTWAGVASSPQSHLNALFNKYEFQKREEIAMW